MILCKDLPGQEFKTNEELFKALKDNKKTLIAQKKIKTKEADSVVYFVGLQNDKGIVSKADSIEVADDVKTIKAELVINTTNLMDSHGDVHINGLWNKTLKENKGLLLLQEHKMTFDSIISDNITATAKSFTWKELGFDYPGSTEALVFDATIDKGRNNFMFNQYANGYVKEHSVGMRYVKMELAINSGEEWDKEEKAIWDKYIGLVANKEDAEAQGYFWAILEAKAIEGSAVVKGSNHATPTINIEAAKGTSKSEPLKDTQKREYYKSLLKH